jgi:diacylglycerol kinase family enzyme
LRAAILTNPHSSRNRRHLARLRGAIRQHRGIHHIETESVDVLPAVAAGLFDEGIELLGINGGDGTIHLVLTALLNASAGRPLPTLALLPGGTTNMSARDINGEALSLWHALDSMFTKLNTNAPHTPRYLMQVSGGVGLQLGFCLGMGAIVRGIEYCHERIYRLGVRDEWASGVALLRAGWGIARREAVFADGVPLQIDIDGEQHDTRVTFFLVSALRELMLGIRPFWGSGDAPLRITLVREHADKFLRSFPDLLRGRPEPKLTPAAGYMSWRGCQIEVAGDCPYTIDGEIYHPEAKQIRIAAFGPVNIIPLGSRH